MARFVKTGERSKLAPKQRAEWHLMLIASGDCIDLRAQ